MDLVIEVLLESLEIAFIVFIMMIFVDLLNVLTRGKLVNYIQDKRWRQYPLASFLGVTPGCAGVYMNVSLYEHGVISFGALAGGMIATSGDSAFIMISMFPMDALKLFVFLFAAGLIFSRIVDWVVKRYNIQISENCHVEAYHPHRETGWHFVRKHIFQHILRKHLVRIVLWILLVMFVTKLGLRFLELEKFVKDYSLLVLIFSAVIALIPEIGPHLLFVTLFANGLIPFSVLFTASFIHDGHGSLPMLAISVKDTIIIKTVNFVFGLSIGIILYLLNL